MHPFNSDDEKDTGAAMEMPRYISHKQVWALEIASANRTAGRVSFVEPGYLGVDLPDEMWARYQPVAGDFYVVYQDGYKSFSPRKAFLEGYSPEKRMVIEKPTVAELEKILAEDDSPVRINPDGSVERVR